MKVELKKLVNTATQAALAQLAKAEITNSGTKFKVIKFVKAVKDHTEDFQEARNEAIKAHGTPKADEEGMFDFTDEGRAAFEASMTALGDVLVDLPALNLDVTNVPSLSAEALVNLMDVANITGPNE